MSGSGRYFWKICSMQVCGGECLYIYSARLSSFAVDTPRALRKAPCTASTEDVPYMWKPQILKTVVMPAALWPHHCLGSLAVLVMK